MFEDLKESLGLNTSPEGGVFDFEVGPVGEHVRAVYDAVLNLRAMSEGYEQDTVVRESVGAGWADRTNVVAVATGVEVAGGVGEELVNMTYGDQLGGLRAPVDANAILRQAEELRQATADDAIEELAQPETVQSVETEGADVIDFTKVKEAQEQKAQEIAAREALGKAYRDHQPAA